MVFSHEGMELGPPALVVDVVPEAQLPEEAGGHCRSWAGEKGESFPGINHIGNGKARLLLFAVGPFCHGMQRWKATVQRFAPLKKLYLYSAFINGPRTPRKWNAEKIKNYVRN